MALVVPLHFPLEFLDVFERAARADSAFLVRSSLITLCWASSMMKDIKSPDFMELDCPPESLLTRSEAVIV